MSDTTLPGELRPRAFGIAYRILPEQCAVLLLRDAFDSGYDENASIHGTTAVNARQLAMLRAGTCASFCGALRGQALSD